MNRKTASIPFPKATFALACVLLLWGKASAQLSGDSSLLKPAIGPGTVLVHSQFGGQIFGFDIDQNGTEGVLSEAQDIGGGKVLAAVETFDQATGKIQHD